MLSKLCRWNYLSSGQSSEDDSISKEVCVPRIESLANYEIKTEIDKRLLMNLKVTTAVESPLVAEVDNRDRLRNQSEDVEMNMTRRLTNRNHIQEEMDI